MKLKRLVIILSMVISFNADAQDAIKVTANNKTTGWWPVSEKPLVLRIHKSDYKNISKVKVEYKQQHVVPAYKSSIAVTSETENQLLLVNESVITKGSYIVNLLPVRKTLLQQNILKVFLLEDPANNRMAMPSRRKLLVELHLM